MVVDVVVVLLFSDDENHPRHIGCIDPACDILLVTEGTYFCLIFVVYCTSSYARLAVVILSVCLSVTRMLCDKTKQCTADILIPHERSIKF